MIILKRYLIYFIILGVVFGLLVIFLALQLLFPRQYSKQPGNRTIPGVSPSTSISQYTPPNESPEYNQSFQQIAEQESPYHAKRQRVAQLILKLPYSGKNFSLEYDYSNNKFYLTLNKQNPELGLNEYRELLKNNGVEETLLEVSTKEN